MQVKKKSRSMTFTDTDKDVSIEISPGADGTLSVSMRTRLFYDRGIFPKGTSLRLTCPGPDKDIPEEEPASGGKLPFSEVIIKFSARRTRTVSARIVGGILEMSVPGDIKHGELKKITGKLINKIHRKELKTQHNRTRPLTEVFARLNDRYFEGKLKVESIEYTARQNRKFGCCFPDSARILLSDRLINMPDWVRDYVVIHEMAHLIEPNHGAAFWNIVSRYKLAERARGYLMGAGFNDGDGVDI